VRIDAIQGIHRHIKMMERHARNIQEPEKADLSSDMVGMMTAKGGLSANITSLKTTLRMQESILDLIA
jgi:flagellar basal body rod protein FlgC